MNLGGGPAGSTARAGPVVGGFGWRRCVFGGGFRGEGGGFPVAAGDVGDVFVGVVAAFPGPVPGQSVSVFG